MVSRLPVIDDDGEVGDLSEVDGALFRPAHEVLPPMLLKTLGIRGPQKAPLKRPTTIRFDADVLAALKATGRGWQTRVNDAMREWVKARGV
jgi:uncharacterized protein (DUF4415 family)